MQPNLNCTSTVREFMVSFFTVLLINIAAMPPFEFLFACDRHSF